MNNDQWLKKVAPELNTMTKIGPAPSPHIFRVCYLNAGQKRVTLEWVGSMITVDQDPSRARIMTPEGKIISMAEFEVYRRNKWPLSHETGRNPENTTLGVNNGTMGAKGGI